MNLSIGKNVEIHSYKHDKSIHRIWKKTIILNQTEDVLVTANYQTRVIENDGRSWRTKEPAICFFYKKYWFNVIAMLKQDGIYFYCNLSSPYLYDGEAIKYIDYDLDYKVYPDGSYYLLDEKEYQNHSNQMCYSEIIKDIVLKQADFLKKLIDEKKAPFDKVDVMKYYEQFIEMSQKKK